jgi:hypothetical protein
VSYRESYVHSPRWPRLLARHDDYTRTGLLARHDPRARLLAEDDSCASSPLTLTERVKDKRETVATDCAHVAAGYTAVGGCQLRLSTPSINLNLLSRWRSP